MFPSQIKPGENPLLVLPRCAVSRYGTRAHYRYNEIPLRCRKFAGESSATCKRPRKQSARYDLGYFVYLNLNAGRAHVRRRRLNAGRHYGLCLPACRATLSPGQKPAIIHCPLRCTVAARVGCTDDFLPALRALLLPGTALSTPVDVGADGS